MLKKKYSLKKIPSSVFIAVLLGCLLVAYLHALFIGHRELLNTRIPTWDEAGHGFDGYILFYLLKSGDFLNFLLEVLHMNYWPPGFAFSSLGFHYFLDGSFLAPRLTSHVFFLASILMSLVLSLKIFGHKMLFPSLLVAVLLAGSPKILDLSVIAMLESSSVFFILLACYFAESLESDKNIKKFWICVSILFFFKYNYAILLSLGVMLRELYFSLWDHPKAKEHFKLLLQNAKIFGGYFLDQLFWKIILFLLLAIWVVLSFGGIETKINSHVIRMKSIANPLYALLLISTVKIFLISYRSDGKKVFDLIHQLPSFWRYFFRFVFVPCALWCFYPPTFKSFVIFVSNQNTTESMSLVERISFYPEAISSVFYGESFSSYFLVGLFILALAQLRFFFKKNYPISFWILGVSFVFCATHKNLNDRYFLPYQPIFSIWMLYGVRDFLRIFKKSLSPQLCNLLFQIACLMVLLGSSLKDLPNELDYKEHLLGNTIDKNQKILISKICEISSKESSVLIGYWIELSPSLVHWICLQEREWENYRNLPPSMARGGYRSEDRNVEEFLYRGKFSNYIWIQYLGQLQAQYKMDTWWQEPVMKTLEQESKGVEGRFKEDRFYFDYGPHELRVFRRIE